MTEKYTFRELIDRVRAGDQAAATELVRVYEPQIRRAIRVRLTDKSVRRVLDSMDICQSVLANFFIRAVTGQFELETPQQLIALLVTMARNKLTDQHRRLRTLRSDQRRESTLDAARHTAQPSPPPDQIIESRDLLSQLYERLSDDECRIARLRAAGNSWKEIAAAEGKSADALRMTLHRAIDRVTQQLGEVI